MIKLSKERLEDDVQAGRLVRLFPTYELPSRTMRMVYLLAQDRLTKLGSFVDFLVGRFS